MIISDISLHSEETAYSFLDLRLTANPESN